MQPARDFTLIERFVFFLQMLNHAFATGCSRFAPRGPIPLIALFQKRVHRYFRRFRRFAEAEDPTALNPKPRKRKERDPDQPKREREPPAVILPRSFGWLRPLIPEQPHLCGLSAAANALVQLLQDPKLEALLKICPTLARDLRPLCHALGIRKIYGHPLPFPPKKPRKPSPPKSERQPRPSRPAFSLSLIPPSRKIAF